MYEPGMKTADVKKIFDDLRPKQVELIKAIQDSQQVDDSFLKERYPKQAQWDFGVELLTAIGFDFNRGRRGDYSAHPFTTSLWP